MVFVRCCVVFDIEWCFCGVCVVFDIDLFLCGVCAMFVWHMCGIVNVLPARLLLKVERPILLAAMALTLLAISNYQTMLL